MLLGTPLLPKEIYLATYAEKEWPGKNMAEDNKEQPSKINTSTESRCPGIVPTNGLLYAMLDEATELGGQQPRPFNEHLPSWMAPSWLTGRSLGMESRSIIPV